MKFVCLEAFLGHLFVTISQPHDATTWRNHIGTTLGTQRRRPTQNLSVSVVPTKYQMWLSWTFHPHATSNATLAFTRTCLQRFRCLAEKTIPSVLDENRHWCSVASKCSGQVQIWRNRLHPQCVPPDLMECISAAGDCWDHSHADGTVSSRSRTSPRSCPSGSTFRFVLGRTLICRPPFPVFAAVGYLSVNVTPHHTNLAWLCPASTSLPAQWKSYPCRRKLVVKEKTTLPACGVCLDVIFLGKAALVFKSINLVQWQKLLHVILVVISTVTVCSCLLAFASFDQRSP